MYIHIWVHMCVCVYVCNYIYVYMLCVSVHVCTHMWGFNWGYPTQGQIVFLTDVTDYQIKSLVPGVRYLPLRCQSKVAQFCLLAHRINTGQLLPHYALCQPSIQAQLSPGLCRRDCAIFWTVHLLPGVEHSWAVSLGAPLYFYILGFCSFILSS